MSVFRSILLVLVLHAVPALAQYNRSGVVHLSAGLGLGAHATEYEQTIRILGFPITSRSSDGAATVSVPIELGVGLADPFSLGLYLEPGVYLDSNATESNNYTLLGMQPRFYLVNNDAFALMGSLRLGLSALRIERDEPLVKSSANYSGGHVGLGLGTWIGFGSTVGLNLHLFYMATNMPLRRYELNGQQLSLTDFEARLRTRGVVLQASLAFRFGG